MTTIRYFIPEDGDVELHPNVFLAPRSRQSNQPPLLNEVKDAFPLPGKYHFRFKSPLVPGADTAHSGKGSNMAVWMDCLDDAQPVPVWRNSIIAKVTRIGIDDEDDSDEDDFREEVYRNGGYFDDTPAATAATTPESNHNYQRSSSGVSSSGAPSRSESLSPTPAPSSSDENLFDVFDSTPAPAAAAPSPHPSSVHSSTPSSNHSSAADLFAMDAAPQNREASLLDMTGGAAPATATAEHDFFAGGATTTTAPAAAPAPAVHDDLLKMRYNPGVQQQPQPQRGQTQGMPGMHHQMGMGAPQHHQQQQQQQQQRPMNAYNNNNAFHTFSQQQGPFGGLSWNNQQQGQGRY